MAEGAQPACWTCERTRWRSEGADVVDVATLLESGFGWETALDVVRWSGTREELRHLIERVGMFRRETHKEQAGAV
jgi:hypothetical protein